MASVRTEISIDAGADEVWAVIGDFLNGPTRMAPGFVLRSELAEPDLRVVTFANDFVLHERLVTRDEENRRIVFAVVGGSMQPTHDNATMQVFDDGPGRSRFVWAHDVLPAELAPRMGAAMEYATPLVKKTFESGS